MLKEVGIVERVSSTKATVRVKRLSACAHCHGEAACRPSEIKEMVVEAVNDINASTGDYVQVSIPSGSLLKATLLVYFLPILGLILGAIAGSHWAPAWRLDPNLTAIIAGGLSMVATFGTVKVLDLRANSSRTFWPRITRILPASDLPHACSR